MNDLDDLLELLFEVARPDIFRANAFRLTGLPIHATERDIRKRLEEVHMSEKYGGTAAQGLRPLPLDSPPDNDTVREAAQRLRDPVLRILNEFFWFWPEPPTEHLMMEALARRDIQAAIGFLTEQAQSSNDPGIAAHNLAVMFHTLALDIEHAWQPGSISRKLRKVQDSYWREGLNHWRVALDSEAVWQQLQARIDEMNDPRLTTEIVPQLRSTLPLAVLLINAQLSVLAAERGTVQEAERCRLFMAESGFADELIEEACQHTAQRLREHIRTLCEMAESGTLDASEEAAKFTHDLLTQSRPPLKALAVLLLEGDQLREDAHDEVATAATNCLLVHCQTSANWQLGLQLLDMARPLAVTSAVRERIDDLRIFMLRQAHRSGNAS